MKWIFAALSLIMQPFMPISGEVLPENRTEVSASANREASLQSLFAIFGINPNASSSEIVADTQKLWLQKGKERWEFDSRYSSLKPDVWPLFEKLGYLNRIHPLH